MSDFLLGSDQDVESGLEGTQNLSDTAASREAVRSVIRQRRLDEDPIPFIKRHLERGRLNPSDQRRWKLVNGMRSIATVKKNREVSSEVALEVYGVPVDEDITEDWAEVLARRQDERDLQQAIVDRSDSLLNERLGREIAELESITSDPVSFGIGRAARLPKMLGRYLKPLSGRTRRFAEAAAEDLWDSLFIEPLTLARAWADGEDLDFWDTAKAILFSAVFSGSLSAVLGSSPDNRKTPAGGSRQGDGDPGIRDGARSQRSEPSGGSVSPDVPPNRRFKRGSTRQGHQEQGRGSLPRQGRPSLGRGRFPRIEPREGLQNPPTGSSINEDELSAVELRPQTSPVDMLASMSPGARMQLLGAYSGALAEDHMASNEELLVYARLLKQGR